MMLTLSRTGRFLFRSSLLGLSQVTATCRLNHCYIHQRANTSHPRRHQRQQQQHQQ